MFRLNKKEFQKWVYDKKVNHYLKRLVTLTIPFKEYRRSLRNRLQNKYFKNKMRNIVKEKYSDAYVLFSRNGVGDVFFVASLINEFKKNHKGKVIYLTEKKSIQKFLKSFSSIDEVLYDKDFGVFQGMAIVQRRIRKGQINFLYFPYRGNKPNYVFADSYANLLELPLDTERDLPQICEEDIKMSNDEFKRLNINPQKTIILIPENVMWNYKVLSPKFWKTLAIQIEKLGYDVVFNSNNREYKNFKTTFLPICAFVDFAFKVKHVISFRSGIDDLLVGMGMKNLTAIYPNNMEVIWADKFLFDELLNKYHVKTKEFELENLMHIYSLNSNFNTNVNEIIYDGFEEDLLETLIDIIK